MTRLLLTCVFLATLLGVFTGCSSAEKRPEDQVQLGMDKSAVLEILGNPKRTARVRGADRWTYETPKNEKVDLLDIYFQDGKVSYVGAPRTDDLKVLKSDKGFKDVTGTEADPAPATPPNSDASPAPKN